MSIMLRAATWGSSNTSDSEDEIENFHLEECKVSKAVIFDWDNTLFCTDYFNMLQLDYKSIFSDKKSLEEEGTYLIYELQSLEEVIIKYNFLENFKFILRTS